MAYIFVAEYGSIFIHFLWWVPKARLFWIRMRIGRSKSSKVVDFGTNRKGVCDFLIVINSNFGPILYRFWDTASYWLKIANEFFLPHSYLTPSLGVNPFEFLDETYRAKTRVMGLLYGENCKILTSTVFCTRFARVLSPVWQTDRRTELR